MKIAPQKTDLLEFYHFQNSFQMQLGDHERVTAFCGSRSRPDDVSVHRRVGVPMTLLVLCNLTCSHFAWNLTGSFVLENKPPLSLNWSAIVMVCRV